MSKNIITYYLSLHKEYTEKYGNKSLVLLQNGKFYETYSITEDETLNGKIIGPDCKHLEEITNVSMFRKGLEKATKVNINNPICWGFPIISEDKYIPDLINDGYTLIIYIQKEENGKIERIFHKIISPGTYINDNDTKTLSNYINCIYIEELQKQNNNYPLYGIGLSSIDVGTGEVYIHESLSKLNDNEYCIDDTIRFNNGINPKEILIIKEDVKISNEELKKLLNLTNNEIIQIKDYNNDYNKLSFQRNLLSKIYNSLYKSMFDILETLNISDKIYIRKSLIHLLMYISDHYTNFITNLNEPIYYFKDDRLFLGNDAINQLNVINNELSLFNIINKCGTLMGKRYIKSILTSPLTNEKELNKIYNISELFKNDYEIIYKNLKNINDIEKIYRKIQLHQLKINRFNDFYKSIENILTLIKILPENIKKELNLNNDYLNKLLDLINYINSKLDIIKCNEYNDLNINNIFKTQIDNDNIKIYNDITKLYIKLNNKHDIINELYNKLNILLEGTEKKSMITKKYSKSKGYYFLITNKRYELLLTKLKNPIELNGITITINNFNIINKKNNKELTLNILTNDINDNKLNNEEITQITNELNKLINTYYIYFLDNILKYNDIIKYFIKLITLIDYYNTIIKISKENNYSKPIIDEKETNCYIDFINLRHPIVERIINYEYIPHSLKLGKTNKGILIYGLNSSGKSVLMKAIGLSIILAQSGFYVPADQFIYKPFKSLYTRITGNDNIYKGLSSYMLEMTELNNIIKRADKNTLIIGDEICRGTEHISGNIIVASSILKLLSLNSIFLFATHLHEIMELPSIKNNNLIKSYYLHVKCENGKLIYDRELKEGIGEKIYGVIVAEQVIKDKEYNDIMSKIKKEVLNTNIKFSKYNKKILMDCCEYCGSKVNLNTHHIHFQKDCENGFSNKNSSIKKNGINNLIVLCEECHQKLHNNEINIKTKILTSEGIEFD